MSRNIKISTWLKNFADGKYYNSDVMTQIDASWYDWFCSDKALRNKTYKLAPKVKRIANLLGDKFQSEHYVFFKNNCPCVGNLYDDFRFCDRKTGDVIFTITPSSGHTCDKGRSEVYGKSNLFNVPLVTGKWKDVVKYFEGLNKQKINKQTYKMPDKYRAFLCYFDTYRQLTLFNN